MLHDVIIPLGRQGARGALFQVSLVAYGYTFVSKATTARFVRELENEAKIYDYLHPIQGVRVPVFLGSVNRLGARAGVLLRNTSPLYPPNASVIG